MSEVLEPWHPSEGVDRELFVHLANFDGENLLVQLTEGLSSKRVLEIDFGSCIQFQISPDAFYSDREYTKNLVGPFYIVRNSNFRKGLEEESRGVFDQNFTHYLIAVSANTIDVLSFEIPKVSWTLAVDAPRVVVHEK